MKNLEIAQIFDSIADLLELKDDNLFKIRAYRKAAQNLRSLIEDIELIAKEDRLLDIPGIGKDLSSKIEEYLKTNHIKHYDELLDKIPKGLLGIMQIPGLGPKTTKLLYELLKIEDIDTLERYAREHRLSGLPGLKDTKEENILKGIELLRRQKERMHLGIALPLACDIIQILGKNPFVDDISYAGSLRRMKDTVRDIDILVASKDADKVTDAFVKLPLVASVTAHGQTKSSILTKDGIQIDLRVVDPAEYGAALLYFTGSKNHNIHLRTIAQKRGLKINEYGIFNEKANKRLASKKETELYKVLGLEYIAPELREDQGEIELAAKKSLPKLIELSDIKGDLHCHSNWSEGANTIEEVVKKAIELGYEYIAITDHSKSLVIANGLDEKRVLKQIEYIKGLNKKLKNFRILTGTEVDIKKDGSLDLDKKVLEKLDIVVASIHSGFKQSKEVLTKRIIKAIQHPSVDIIAHPTGRLLGERDAYEVDLEAILKVAKEKGVALEINSYPQRLDLNDADCRLAKEHGVSLVIDSDEHMAGQMNNMYLGVCVARRGWLERKDVLNTLELADLLKKVNRK